jgi:hypothetical protein
MFKFRSSGILDRVEGPGAARGAFAVINLNPAGIETGRGSAPRHPSLP